MKHIFLILALALLSHNSYGETVSCKAGETAKEFAERNAQPDANLTHQVIEATVFGKKNVVIAFYEEGFDGEGCQDCKQIVGYIYLPHGTTYEKTLIYRFEPEGGDPTIESVFFANANKEPSKEIIIIVSWPVTHSGVAGTLYGTYIFALPQADSSQLTLLKEISSKLEGGCECWYSDSGRKKARYKTAAEVKAGLKKLGF